MNTLKKKPVYDFIKRAFDIICSGLALLILSPVFLVLILLIRRDGGPAFYTQVRVGKDGKLFRIYKFRSMCVNADSPEMLEKLRKFNEMDGPAFKMKNDPRVTKIGRFIRKTSLDELPQFLNIFKGDMTFVGPRPALEREVAQYAPEHHERLLVKQGLTCYWQCSGRNNIAFEEWMQMDIKYVRERGLWTDFKILLKTVPAVLSGNGAQ